MRFSPLRKRLYQYTVIVADGNKPSIKSPARVGTKGKAVGDDVIVRLGKRNNVAGVYHLHVFVCNDAYAGDAAGVVVNAWHFFFENTTTNKKMRHIGERLSTNPKMLESIFYFTFLNDGQLLSFIQTQ